MRARTAMRRMSSCEGKTRFETFGRAERHASRATRRFAARLTPYACSFCGGFHVGRTLGHEATYLPDTRARYSVFAHLRDGPVILAGYSDSPDGGATAKSLTEEGWEIDSIMVRRYAA
jgi:hypothetical protein